MCGRYSLTFAFEGLAEVFNAVIDALEAIPPRYNVAPTQSMPVITREQGQNHLKVMRWGLIPSWAKDKSIGSRLINARLETLTEKPAYKKAVAQRRCLIPADGYYEWQAVPGQRLKQPYRIVAAERPVFAMAGLWETWGDDAVRINTFTIVTADASSPQVAAVHHRMPLILSPEQEQEWLDGPVKGQSINNFLHRFQPETNLRIYPVSTLVNSPAHDDPRCILPI